MQHYLPGPSHVNAIKGKMNTIDARLNLLEYGMRLLMNEEQRARLNLLEYGMRLVMNEEQRANNEAYERAKGKQPSIDPIEDNAGDES
ncbi:hypothetical protein ACH5RR_008157 [Cinchona calisaya]|uniref:Uncharacterized protein n=1 Tax=Cinchona calisaya TaxID=153742 RepID=A0ABD3AE76_9GENT